MNDFDKNIVFAFYNSFLKIELIERTLSMQDARWGGDGVVEGFTNF